MTYPEAIISFGVFAFYKSFANLVTVVSIAVILEILLK